jgi:hypothetical protein
MRPVGCLLHLVRLQVYAYQHQHESLLGCRIQLVCLQVYSYWHLPKSSLGCRMRPRGVPSRVQNGDQMNLRNKVSTKLSISIRRGEIALELEGDLECTPAQ